MTIAAYQTLYESRYMQEIRYKVNQILNGKFIIRRQFAKGQENL